jgi:hypothetical protein
VPHAGVPDGVPVTYTKNAFGDSGTTILTVVLLILPARTGFTTNASVHAIIKQRKT